MTRTPQLFLLALLLLTQITSAQLSPEDRQLASDLYKKFTAAKDDLATRTTIVQEMADLGSTVAKVIHPIIDREFRSAYDRYQAGFLTQAKSVAAKKDSRDKSERIKKLRADVQSLRSKANLSKENIQSIGDPAVTELRSLTKIERNEIIDSSDQLQKARADLLELGKQRNITIDALVIIDLEIFDADALKAQENEIASAALSIDRDAIKILEQNKKLAAEVEPAEADGIANLNELRILIGLRPCLIDPKLCAASRGHSKDMAEKNFFSHTSPVPGKAEFTTRAKLEGTTANSENIFAGSSSGAAANKAWWYSPGHHINMLAPNPSRVGMGVSGNHWTQMFGG